MCIISNIYELNGRMWKVMSKELWKEMEYLRKDMDVKVNEKGISHPDVLVVSERLDKVINKLFKLDDGVALH